MRFFFSSSLAVIAVGLYLPSPFPFEFYRFISIRVHAFTVLTGTAAREGSVLDVKDHCNKTVEIYEDVSSPELTNANRNRPLLCTYRFRSFRGAPRDWVLRIRFKKFKVGNILNATHCDGGYLQVCKTFSVVILFLFFVVVVLFLARAFASVIVRIFQFLGSIRKIYAEKLTNKNVGEQHSMRFNKSNC